MRRTLGLGIVLALLSAGWALAGTTGDLKGIVTDDTGGALPGATVTIEAPTLLGGVRTAQSDLDGVFSFPAIAPGFYTVTIELDGFATQEQSEVQVRLDRTTDLRVTLKIGEFAETVLVTGELAPVIDPEQVSVSQTFTIDYLAKASVGVGERSYQSVLNESAGVAGGANPNVFGSTQGENAYYVDGFNTTDPVTSTFGLNLGFDFVQEISANTAGFEAEYGGATGGVINVITKSGGNDFHGAADLRYYDESFFESGEFFDPDAQKQKTLDPTLFVGGPIIQDKLWFFAGYNPVETQRTTTGSPTTRVFNGDYQLGKLSWQTSPSWLTVLKYNADPADIENSAGSEQFRPAETQSLQEQGSKMGQVNASGVISDDLLIDMRVGIARDELNVTPMSGDLDLPGEQNPFTGEYFVNYGNAQYSDRDRDFAGGSATLFVDELAGDHQFKGGFEYNDIFFRRQNFVTGDYAFTRRVVQGRDIYRSFTHDPNRDVTDFSGLVAGLYVQDSWNLTPKLTLKLGLRYDQGEFDDNLGNSVADLAQIQPRVGLAWDFAGDGKTIGRLSWGRFMHPSALTTASFAQRGANLLPSVTAFSCNYVRTQTFGLPPDDTTPCSVLAEIVAEQLGWQGEIVQEPGLRDPEGWIVSDVIGAGVPNVVDPNLDPTFQDTLIIGVERQIFERTSVELSYVNKDTEDIFEDTCNGAFPDPAAGHACDFYVMANLPGLRREYDGVILRAESRATDWLHLTSSLTWSESKGNVEYTQNAGIDFDYYPEHYVNTFGYLSDHRRFRFKINGYIDLPLDFGLGINAFWSSSSVWNIERPAEIAGYGTELVEPRGSLEGNENYQLDLQATKAFRFGNDMNVQLIAAVINVFDRERPTELCETEDGCGGGTELGNAIDWQLPRQYQVGFRFEF